MIDKETRRVLNSVGGVDLLLGRLGGNMLSKASCDINVVLYT